MAFTEEELEQIKALMASNQPATPQGPPAPEPTVDRVQAPWYYVHLADGRVLETQDSQSTNIEGKAVIGRYAMSPEDSAAAQERQ
jgi:hypothetical protein